MRIFSGMLGHEHTLLKDGRCIKDLSYMNRDIEKIIVIDVSDEKIALHKDNVLKI